MLWVTKPVPVVFCYLVSVTVLILWPEKEPAHGPIKYCPSVVTYSTMCKSPLY